MRILVSGFVLSFLSFFFFFAGLGPFFKKNLFIPLPENSVFPHLLGMTLLCFSCILVEEIPGGIYCVQL